MLMVKMFNFYYFFYVVVAIMITLVVIRFLKNKSEKFRYWFIYGIILLNVAIHFLKVLIYPYTLIEHSLMKASFENICAASVLLFPFLYFTKNKTLKDYMVMIGIASGILTYLFPLDAMSLLFNGYVYVGPRPAFMLENIRFYFAHYLLFLAPFLMMHFKMHELSIKRAYRAPIVLFAVLLLIFINELLLTWIGWVPKSDMFDPNKRNPSMIFGPKDQFKGLGLVIGVLVPSFMAVTHPVYGFTYHLPVLWLLFPLIVFGGGISIIFCLIYDTDATLLFFKKLFKIKTSTTEEIPKQ